MILLVEDSEDDVFIMKRALRKASISLPVQLAKNGREAVEYLQGTGKFSDRCAFPIPSLIFLDLKLPYIHGLEVLRWIKQEPSLCHITVAILSSSLENSDQKKADELGAKTFLVKPPTPEMLLGFLKSLPGFVPQSL